MVWIFFLILVVGCVYAFNLLKAMEVEIRAEIDSGSPESEREENIADSTHATPARNESGSVENRIMAFIRNSPGIRQSELYKEFNVMGKTTFQKELLNLDRSGKISRIRSGNTYKLSLME